MTLRLLSRYALALLFVLAGSWHFVHPATYLAIMPPQLPQPLALVYASGVFEILGGLGLLPVRARRLAGGGLLALLVAVFPANLYMALIHEQLHIPGWVAWGRLPLQLPLLWWVWQVMKAEKPMPGRG
ncbi:DoxX family protein [Hymenobacter terricola]|uniref:DoxX family protein n=1 Tax=Hymenobacter terricola TaxID=2819236 RepID=UPI001B3054BB|nr:DoxX family membrane protein [Hymenobacter terricola]